MMCIKVALYRIKEVVKLVNRGNDIYNLSLNKPKAPAIARV